MKVYTLSKDTIQRWQWGDPLLRHLTDYIMRLVDVRGGQALDVGCGTGRVTVTLARAGFKVTGLDPAADVVAQASELAADLKLQIDFVTGDFSQPDPRFADETFDLVVCSEVLEHIVPWQSVLENIRLVLKRGRCLILTVPNDPAQFSMLDTYAGHLRRFRWSELEGALNGFNVEQAFTVGFPLTRTVHWAYTRVALPLLFREHRPDQMWRQGSAYSGVGAEALYRAIQFDDFFNGLRRGTTWVVKARKI
jgi:ubiquinone/menaquinone biosynthesis C-methylase UbiE